MKKLKNLLDKMLSWLKSHLAVVWAGIIFVVLSLFFAASGEDRRAFSAAIKNMKKHYKTSQDSVESAVRDDQARQADIEKRHDDAVKKADDLFDAKSAALEDERDDISAATTKKLKKNRAAVADEIARKLGANSKK